MITVNIFTGKPGMSRGGIGIGLKAEITNSGPSRASMGGSKLPDGVAAGGHRPAAGETRISFRRALKQARRLRMKVPGVEGIKTSVSGRLELARTSPAPSTTTTAPSRCQTLRVTSTAASLVKAFKPPGREGLDLQGESPRRKAPAAKEVK